MKFLVSSELIDMYKYSHKNPNYMLDYYLTSIDYQNCIKYNRIIKEFKLIGEKKEIEISEDNVNYIKDLFKTIDDNLVEKLLWLAVFLKEV